MALQKTVETHFGTDAVYWKICCMEFDWLHSSVNAQLKGFVSKEARDAIAAPLKSVNFSFSDEEFDFVTTDNLVEKLYEKIKLDEDWADATDS